MSAFAVGIDFGTSTSEIACYRDGELFVIPDPTTKSPISPTIAAVDPRGQLRTGSDALALLDKPGFGVREIKRELGSGRLVSLGGNEYRPEEIAAYILRMLKERAEEHLGASIRDVVLSVPANFSDAARSATKAAGELAGLNIVRLINEPTAAALAFGINNMDVEEQIVVFDFGGGTLDITVLEMMSGVVDVKCSFGDPNLGGKEFDEILQRLLLQKFLQACPGVQVSETCLPRLKSLAERVKRHLSAAHTYSAFEPAFGMCESQPADLELEVTRTEFESHLRPVLEKARSCLDQAMKAKDVRLDSIDRVLLVGGTTYIPAVRQLVSSYFGKEPRADVEPDLAVAKGAAVQAALAAGLISAQDGIILSDTISFGLGLKVLSEVGSRWVEMYDPLMKPNQKIPFSAKRLYSLVDPNQRWVKLHLLQDHHGTARLADEAVKTGLTGDITDIPPSNDGRPHPIEVEFAYNISGIIELAAVIPGTGKSIRVSWQSSPLRMSAREKSAALGRMREIWKGNAQAAQYEGVIGQAERILAELPPDRRDPIQSALFELKDALARGGPQDVQRCGDRLVDLLFEVEHGL